MTVYRTSSYHVSLSPHGYRKLEEIFARMRWFYNCALEHRRDAYKDAGISISRNDQFKELTEIRKIFPDFIELSVQVQRGVLHRLDRAMQAFFRRVKAGENPGFPRFKGKNSFTSLEIEDVRPTMVRDNKINVKGLPTIRLKGDVPISSLVKKIVIKWTPIGVYIDIVHKIELEPLPAAQNPIVGIDVGVNKCATSSDGVIIERRRTDDYIKVKYQRELARKKKGSKSWYQTVRKLARLEYRRKVRNRNATHRITTKLVKEYAGFVLEDLDIQNMTKRGGKRKKSLNREILKQTWGIFAEQLFYKAESAGRIIAKVDPRYTSQTCSHCRNVDKASRRGEIYNCSKCGLLIDADINAARNILLRYTGENATNLVPVERVKML